MAQLWLLWWPKTTTKTCVDTVDSTTAATTTTTTTTTTRIVENGKPNCCTCGCLTKLVKKIKKQGRMLRAATASRKSSFQCRYDPLSYSLNFDTGGRESLLDDEDYYQFCAFSSRFVANPRTSSPTLVATSHYKVETL